MSRNCKADELQRLTTTARIAAQTRFDLAAFAALDPATKAARWRQFDQATKLQVVQLALVAKHGDCDQALIAHHVAKLDARWGQEPTTTEAVVSGELARLADAEAQHARAARQVGEMAHAKDYQRMANAYANALAQYQAGIRPVALAGGRWTLPSRRSGEPAHVLTLESGLWVCTCAAGATAHWASALMVGIEVADDAMLDADDDEPGADCPDHGPHAEDDCPKCRCEIEADLGARIARARRQAYANV